jgi:hypothetical protein
VALDGVQRDEQLVGDFLVGQATRQAGQDLGFALCEDRGGRLRRSLIVPTTGAGKIAQQTLDIGAHHRLPREPVQQRHDRCPEVEVGAAKTHRSG